VREVIFIMKAKYGTEDLKAVRKIDGAERVYSIEMIMDSCLNQSIKWSENCIGKL
jgi:hypothetical protein